MLCRNCGRVIVPTRQPSPFSRGWLHQSTGYFICDSWHASKGEELRIAEPDPEFPSYEVRGTKGRRLDP